MGRSSSLPSLPSTLPAWELGVFNAVVALTIAVIKAVLVILFFMHIRYSSKLVKLTICSGFFTLIVLLSLTLTDYISRAWGLW